MKQGQVKNKEKKKKQVKHEDWKTIENLPLCPSNHRCIYMYCFPGGSDGKASTCNAGDPGSIAGSGRSPGEGSPLQYSCLKHPMDGGVWWATVHGVSKSRTQRITSLTNLVKISCNKILLLYEILLKVEFLDQRIYIF